MMEMAGDRILFVVAHPDDEVLGAGGLIHRISQQGKIIIRVAILGEGLTSRLKNRSDQEMKSELKLHQENVKAAQNVLGYQELNTFHLADNRFDSYDLLDVIKIVEEEINDFQPRNIFTHHGGDLNIDHRITFNSVMTACRPLPKSQIRSIYSFETLSSTEWIPSGSPHFFQPNAFFEISKQDLEAKVEAMKCYEFEQRNPPHPRSADAIESLARFRGSIAGFMFAEAFQLVRSLAPL